MVLADTDILHQVLTALLDNAHKYGAPDQSIDVTVAKQAQHVTLSVADHGPGISTADRPHIFERFYRVDESRSNKIEGSGLGLAIVAQLVRLSKGTITITDNPPHGACFIISLPSANEN